MGLKVNYINQEYSFRSKKMKYGQTCANDHRSATTTLNPAQAILVLKLPLNNDHLSTTTSGHLNIVPKNIKTCPEQPLLSILTIF